MKKLFGGLLLVLLLMNVYPESIKTGDSFYYIEYDGNVIWAHLQECRLLEIFPINQNMIKVVIDIPFNKAGAFNTYTWYMEKGKELSLINSNDGSGILFLTQYMLETSSGEKKSIPDQYKFVIDNIMYNKIELKKENEY